MKLATCAGLLFVAVYCVANIEPNEGESSDGVAKSRKKRGWGGAAVAAATVVVGAGMPEVYKYFRFDILSECSRCFFIKEEKISRDQMENIATAHEKKIAAAAAAAAAAAKKLPQLECILQWPA